MMLLLVAAALAQSVGDAGGATGIAAAGDAFSGALAQGMQDAPVSASVRILLILTGMSFLPAMFVVMTPFVRFVVVFSMLRQALGLQSSPPNQVIIGLSLFLTLLVMGPTFERSYTDGLAPLMEGTMEPGAAFDAALRPMREFMLGNTRRSDMATILEAARQGPPDNIADLGTPVIASAFVLSELKTALIISVYVFIPFLVIDLVTSSVLMGLGMMMLPPVTVSLPFKIIVFVLMDGWGLLVRDMVAGINR